MFADLNGRTEHESSTCPCYACFVYGQRLVCHSRWRPQAVDAEDVSGWGA